MTKYWTSTQFPERSPTRKESIWWVLHKSNIKHCNELLLPGRIKLYNSLWVQTVQLFFFFFSFFFGLTSSAAQPPPGALYLMPSWRAWRRSWSRRRPKRGRRWGCTGCRSGWWSIPSFCWGQSTPSSTHSHLLRERKNRTVTSPKLNYRNFNARK